MTKTSCATYTILIKIERKPIFLAETKRIIAAQLFT